VRVPIRITNMNTFKTPVAARQLGKPYWVVYAMVRSGRIPAPPKDSSGDYVWTAADIERARAALAAGPRKRGEATACPA
jgi:hypothetical protein